MNPYVYAGLPAEKQAFAACRLIPGWAPKNKAMQHKAAQHVVAEMYGITVEELRNPPDRRMMFVEARAMMYFYLRMRGGYTYTDIGKMYGRDHSSVVHNMNKMKNALRRKNSPERAGLINLLHECGHIPSLLVNTVPGAQYLDSIFDREAYKEFFALDLSKYDEFDRLHNRRLLKAKLQGKDDKEDQFTYWSRIREDNLNGVYHRNYKKHNR